jgi:GNAT superfamily N-acetyltransferase
MIELREAITPADKKKFVVFPFSLYKDSPYWVPPIIKDEVDSFNPEKNPAFDNARARFFIAYRNGKAVGRIAAIINDWEVKEQGIAKMRFGWFDFIDDLEVSKALLDKVVELGKEEELAFIEGPVGFSNLDKVGVMTDGFEHIGTMITWYNHPYYEKHYREYDMLPEKKYDENTFPFANAKPEFFGKAADLITRRYKLKPKSFKRSTEVMPFADAMFDLFNESYASLSSFVRITDRQKEFFKKKYISFINPEYIKFVFDEEGSLIAFGIVMPAFAKALQKAKGKLFPTGIFHLLKAKKNSKDVIFYLIGVHPKWQNKGITAVVFKLYHETFKAKGIQNCYRTPELEDNEAIHKIWKNFDPVVYKRRCTFRKDF